MGNGMNKVLPGLYVGNYRDSKDLNQLEMHKITHILAIHDNPKHLFQDKHYLCVMAADNPDQDLTQFFSVCNDFIHSARARQDCNVLIHCLAGMSRSVTICVAYIMSVSNLSWRDALRVVRVGRKIANPNTGFQLQLQDFEINKLEEERRRMKERYPSVAIREADSIFINRALENFDALITSRDLCHFNCKRHENCPTGVCRMNHDAKQTGGIFSRRRTPSTASVSSSSSRLSIQSRSGSASCPTSPRHTPKILPPTPSSSNLHSILSSSNSCSSSNFQQQSRIADSSDYRHHLQRSSSNYGNGSSYKHRSGYYSYTNSPSAPTSAHSSRVDLTTLGRPSTGSAIYLSKSSGSSGSKLSLVSRSQSLSSPNSSPKHRARQ